MCASVSPSCWEYKSKSKRPSTDSKAKKGRFDTNVIIEFIAVVRCISVCPCVRALLTCGHGQISLTICVCERGREGGREAESACARRQNNAHEHAKWLAYSRSVFFCLLSSPSLYLLLILITHVQYLNSSEPRVFVCLAGAKTLNVKQFVYCNNTHL